MNCRTLIFLSLKHSFERKVEASNLIKSKNISKLVFFLFGTDELNRKGNLFLSIEMQIRNFLN